MKENLKYRISEKSNHSPTINIQELINNVENLYNDTFGKESDIKETCETKDSDINETTLSEILATSLHYETNLNLDKLQQIANYYKITHRKKKKADLAKDLAIFEHDINNIDFVTKRKKMWENVKELKQDDFFKQYILFDV